MSRVKSSGTPHYELLYIISNKFSEDELEPVKEKVNKAIADNSGVITFSEDWGKKRFAYPISHFRQGYYNLVEFDLIGENLTKVDRLLRMSSEILRHQIVRKKIKTREEIERDNKITEKIAARKEEEKEKQVKEEEKEEEMKKESKKNEGKVKDLDEKLDELLKAEDLL